ncbi:MAG: hypothetical protein V3S07_09950 [Micropepsaceae bacterium]
MRTNFVTLLPIVILAAATMAGCSTTMQTTSGQDWLNAVPASSFATGGPPGGSQSDLNRRIVEAASVEPILRFPARIGLAKIGPSNRNGYRVGIASPTAAEAEIWGGVAQRLGVGFGEFVPISPLIAAMLEPERPNGVWVTNAKDVLDKIRLAAARQHLDAVIVYEVDATTNTHDTPLSIADWTLIGAIILPSQGVNAQGVAQAMLLDVRNGYHYGTVQTSADDESYTTKFSSSEAQEDLSERFKLKSTKKLAAETEILLRNLRLELAELDLRAQGS